MALGTITITDPGAVVAPLVLYVAARDYRLSYQANTLSASLSPGRSTYGTFQQAAFPTTVSPKRLWVFSGLFMTTPELQSFEALVLTRQPALNATPDFLTLTDACKLAEIDGGTSAKDVQIVVGEDYLDDEVLLDRGGQSAVWRVSFAALEV